MKKEVIRKEFFKLKFKGHSYNQCRKILKAKYDYEIHHRTLQRGMYKLDYDNDWNLGDKSRRPKTIHKKISKETEEKIIKIKKQTGWGAEKIENFVDVGHSSINKILNKYNLTNPSKRKKKRNKYIRWERNHPNSLWQIDHSDQK
ncbi:hypothetical protein KAJ87_03470, partial [Candidatus Pacearchaeota archaeon]|nr:hypothetical protein [Candidatus Pacearchaeota archaeon]